MIGANGRDPHNFHREKDFMAVDTLPLNYYSTNIVTVGLLLLTVGYSLTLSVRFSCGLPRKPNQLNHWEHWFGCKKKRCLRISFLFQ